MNSFFAKVAAAVQALTFIGITAVSSFTHAGELKVYAAASLTDVITRLAGIYQQAHPQTQIKFSFAGSSTLARQIRQGAPADLFIFADKDWADYLHKNNWVDTTNYVDLLTNELVLIAPTTHTLNINLQDTASLAATFKGKLCTGDPEFVPVGKYAKQALEFYGWWSEIQPRLVATEDVRTALAFVARGECTLGIVYKTDALISKKVRVVASFSGESHRPIVYPGGLNLKAGPEAKAFWIFLQSKPAQAVFIEYGFGVAQKR